jgi:hypothetical protein
MYRTFRSSKDTYITDRVYRGKRNFNTNVGRAGTMDIYKLYGVTKSGSNENNELTRGLIKFDIQKLKDDYAAGQFDISSPNFKCNLFLYDVYGGQTTPDNFKLCVIPLAQDFEEGIGRDVVFYQDRDICNFLTASENSTWFLSGANAKGNLGNSNIDVIVSGNLGAGLVPLWKTQSFVTGDENLDIDVTQYVSGVLAGIIPDYGFRISFIDSQESDKETRFVKRFVTKEANDPKRHPKLIVKYDDSVSSNYNNFVFDYPGTIFLYNNVRGTLKNIISSSVEITGSNCLLVKLNTEISGGFYTLTFSGSQHTANGQNIKGVYSASFSLSSSDPILYQKIIKSGSVDFDLVWGSLDGSVGYHTSSEKFVVRSPIRNSNYPVSPHYVVSAINLSQEYKKTDKSKIRVHIEDTKSPYSKFTKRFFETPSYVPERAYYSIRDSVSNEIVIDFDDVFDSTKLSSDATSLWFELDMSNFYEGCLYEIDIMIVENNTKRYYRGISGTFKISSTV